MSQLSPPLVCIETTGVSLKALATTAVGVTENGTRRFYPLWVVVSCDAATAITIGASVSVGTTNANEILGITVLTSVLTANQLLTVMAPSPTTPPQASIAPNTTLNVKVTTAATGTTQTATVRVFGFYN